MPLTRSTTIRLLRTTGVVIIICIVVGYAIWRSLNYVRGPEILIFEPSNGSSIATSTTIIRGQAERINNLSLNGSPLSIDESGRFGLIIAIFPGLNILSFTAQDQFGRTTETELRLFGTVPLPTMRTKTTVPKSASSTPQNQE